MKRLYRAVLLSTAIALTACGPRSESGAANSAVSNPVVGTADSDHLNSTPGADAFDGGEGFDYVHYDTAPAGVTVNLADPSRNAGEAAGDTFVSIQGVVGSPHDDIITGSEEQNDLHGGSGGNDQITGLDGDDRLTGDVGDDVLDGGRGADTYIGGAGNDSFVLRRGEADGDKTEGFESGDTLVFVGYGPGATFQRAGGNRWQVRTADGLVVETVTIDGDVAAPNHRFE